MLGLGPLLPKGVCRPLPQRRSATQGPLMGQTLVFLVLCASSLLQGDPCNMYALEAVLLRAVSPCELLLQLSIITFSLMTGLSFPDMFASCLTRLNHGKDEYFHVYARGRLMPVWVFRPITSLIRPRSLRPLGKALSSASFKAMM